MNVGSILVGGLDLTQGAMEEEDFKPGSCDKCVVYLWFPGLMPSF